MKPLQRKLGLGLAFVAVFVTGGLAGLWVSSWAYYKHVFGRMVDRDAADLSGQMDAVSRLRRGEVNAVVGWMEEHIDRDIVSLASTPYMARTDYRLKALGKAKAYREGYPSQSTEVSEALKDIPQTDYANQPGTLTRIGQTAPDFEITTVDGQRVKLSDLRGKVVVLDLFATWCGPCLQELPRLEQEVWRVYQDKPFGLLVIGREETADTLKAFRQEHGFTFPLAADPDRSVYARFADDQIPRTYVIDPKGVIVYQCTGYVEWEFAKMVEVIRKETQF